MYASTIAVAAIASVVAAQANTTVTATEESTTLVTITSCVDNACHETTSAALVSTATVTVNDVITEYTTWCPLPTEVPSNQTTTPKVFPSTGAAVKALPAVGALIAGAAALLL